MNEDPIVAEIRRFRAEHAEKYGHDLGRICEALREAEAKSAGKVKPLGNTWLRPCALSRKGRATTNAVISAAAGLPGKPIQGLPATSPKAKGFPG